ncbi:ABC transporter permease subunit [Bradyrhizobium manausense]
MAMLVALAPGMLESYELMQATSFAALSMLALSLGFIWGFGGILSFGQAAFFGLGAYTYAVTSINFGDSTSAVALAVAVPGLLAGALGYFMFYGRISDAYVSVVTLTVTLVLFNLVNSTAGDEYRIGIAALGGFNGMPAVPGLNVPFNPGAVLDIAQTWYAVAGSLVLVYAALASFLASRFGRAVVAIRENEARASLLGYDPRAYKLLIFVMGGGVAGLAGAFFTAWGAFVSPTIFGLALSGEIVVWVMVGGLRSLIGPVVGCCLVKLLVSEVGAQQAVNPNLVLGVVLMVFVLLVPTGLVPLVREYVQAVILRVMRGQPSIKTAETVAAE